MYKILIAMPCLLVSGLAMAKDPHALRQPSPPRPPRRSLRPPTASASNMTHGGKRMTADDFDAWMKKYGYRVATGAPAKKGDEAPAADGGKK